MLQTNNNITGHEEATAYSLLLINVPEDNACTYGNITEVNDAHEASDGVL
jgi:hypothetical protein